MPTFVMQIKTNIMRLQPFVLVLLISLVAGPLSGQVVVSDPPFIIATEPVTITFDATQGDRGLEDCNCAVYLHTGTITSSSSSPTDWQNVRGNWGTVQPELQMTSVGDNLYTFTMTPSEFYDIPSGDELLQLTFVFRNGDGSASGRAEGGNDVFLDVVDPSDGLQLLLQRPVGTVVVEEAQSTIDVVAFSNIVGDWTIEDNGTVVHTVNGASTVDYALAILRDDETLHEVTVTVNTAQGARTNAFRYVVLGEPPVGDPAVDTDAGLTVMPDGQLRLKLIAPGKTDVQVLTSDNDFEIGADLQMTRSVNGDFFWIDVPQPSDSDWLLYQYLIDGSVTVADPMATLVLDPAQDQWIQSSYFPNYPAGAQGIVTAERHTGHRYDWQVDGFTPPADEDLIIYELLVRDFLGSHNYSDLRDTLPYLKRLGVNAIQLMPVQEFEGNESWGYNPSYHKALDKYYGTPVEFKQLVDACHAAGIAVILDVVYNHAFSQSPLCRMWWDDNNFRPTSDNPYLNVEATHPFNVGYDFNHESSYTRQWVKDVVEYWTTEYRVDGYRFDLSKGFTQRNTPNDIGAWGSYDASRIAILNDYRDDIRSYDEDAILILEHFADNSEERELSEGGFLFWGNMNYSYRQASMGFTTDSDLRGALASNRGWEDPHLISYMESHDEERTMYENLEFGNSTNSYDTREFETAIDRQKLISVFHYLLPGPKMLWQFGELGYDYSINYCPDGTVRNECRLANKPIRWDYYQDPVRRALYDHITSLVELRNTVEIGTVDNIKQLLSGAVKKLELRKGDTYLFMVGNFDVVEQTTGLEFSTQGIWTDYFTGEERDNTMGGQSITLQPGEYRVYTNEGLRVSVEAVDDLARRRAKVYPNPATDLLTVDVASRIDYIWAIDAMGKTHEVETTAHTADISKLAEGYYHLLIGTDGQQLQSSFIKL